MPISEIMTFLAGSLLTLYLSILELRKEKKSIAKIAILMTLFCIFLFSGLYDILKKNDSDSNNHTEIVSSISTSKDTIQLAIDSVRNSIVDSIKKSKEEIKQHADSTFIDIINTNNYKDYTPVLDICVGPPNPNFVLSNNEDSLNCKIGICNIGNDHAYSIISKIIPINYIKNAPEFINISTNSFSNKSSILPNNNQTFIYHFKLYMQDNNQFVFPLTHPIFVYFRFDYLNRNKKRMKPLQVIYSLKESGFFAVDQNTYEKIENDLKKNKYW